MYAPLNAVDISSTQKKQCLPTFISNRTCAMNGLRDFLITLYYALTLPFHMVTKHFRFCMNVCVKLFQQVQSRCHRVL
jgi:hypothetical protein